MKYIGKGVKTAGKFIADTVSKAGAKSGKKIAKELAEKTSLKIVGSVTENAAERTAREAGQQVTERNLREVAQTATERNIKEAVEDTVVEKAKNVKYKLDLQFFSERASKHRSVGQYHTFHKFELDSDFLYASDAVQFRQANKSLINTLNTDAKFRKDMFSRKPELKTWLDNNPNLSNSPTGFTWHHAEEPGILKLVDRGDHSTNFSIYHPTGKGGRDIWGGGKLGRRGKLK